MRWAAPLLVLASLWLTACGERMDCSNAVTVLAEAAGDALTCGEAAQVADYMHILAARGPSGSERERVVRWVGSAFTADPVGTRALLAAVVEAGRELEALTGLEGAERRARLIWETKQGRGVIRPEHGDAWAVLDKALGVWAMDDATQLALTEMDIEAWLRYASLCRQVQGGGTLALSVSDRVQLYRLAQERFQGGGRAEQVALVALGPYWGQIREGWEMASYERQQAWIAAAPLPPPMTANSLAYAETILRSDLAAHARVMHERIGPFTMVKGRPAFAQPREP